MNLIKTFEDRMNSVFGAGATGVTSPFSLRKLAKRAAKEMEAETFDIDGIATAPALYTILVSEQDDANIRSLYLRLIQEISSFIEAKAQSKSYVFTGKPLIRFMVDPGLKSGKFAVFAENVDAFTLSRLRAEEDAFFQGSLGLGGAASEQLENSKSSEPVNMDAHVSAGAAQPAQAFATPVRDVASPDDSVSARRRARAGSVRKHDATLEFLSACASGTCSYTSLSCARRYHNASVFAYGNCLCIACPKRFRG